MSKMKTTQQQGSRRPEFFWPLTRSRSAQLKIRSKPSFSVHLVGTKRAQLKMMENMGIMLVFFMLVGIGFIFYAKVSGHSTVQQLETFGEIRAVKLTQKVSALPEVRCTEENVQQQDCFDLLRAEEASILMTDTAVNKMYYLEILGFSKVVLREHYPGGRVVDFYDNKPHNWTDYIPIEVPISLYDASEDSYSFGVLEVGTYDKK